MDNGHDDNHITQWKQEQHDFFKQRVYLTEEDNKLVIECSQRYIKKTVHFSLVLWVQAYTH